MKGEGYIKSILGKTNNKHTVKRKSPGWNYVHFTGNVNGNRTGNLKYKLHKAHIFLGEKQAEHETDYGRSII